MPTQQHIEALRTSPNLNNKGLISIDRNNKATLLLTIPRHILKSSTMDPTRVNLYNQGRADNLLVYPNSPSGTAILIHIHPTPYFITSSMGSDLEAFSHNPADGSFAALPDQTAANTNYPNELFLSY